MQGFFGSFFHGVRLLIAGFGWWRKRPGVMALGLVPAAIVGLVLSAALVGLALVLPDLADALTPFADGWPGIWATLIRAAVGTAVLGSALVLAAVTFTTLTLIVGEPFYDRIWRAVERREGGEVPEADYGFLRSTVDALAFFVRGLGVAIVAGLAGLVPIVGSVIGAVLGVSLTGWLLADELASRALMARGLSPAARKRLLRRHRGATLGFGVATQLCFLVPLGAVVTMPAAVAGSTLLARELVAGDVGSTAASLTG
ncbi:EI24 domain-containing protein [Microbacterium sp. P02]|uniref:EI24 domain-containing protein n=1 Tax=Microbacterium sp. P02 TaxID=3366260 RepID=UPI00366A738C